MMSDDIKLYRIEEESTTGWATHDKLVKLTKEQCKEKYDILIAQGSNPNYLRIVRDDV